MLSLISDERKELTAILLEFVRRVASETEKKTPAEVAILPEMISLLYAKGLL